MTTDRQNTPQDAPHAPVSDFQAPQATGDGARAPDGAERVPPAEAVEAVMEALGCSATATAWADREETRRVVVCAAHRDEWIAQGCPVAVSVAAAAVAALDLPKRDREATAKARDDESAKARRDVLTAVISRAAVTVTLPECHARQCACNRKTADEFVGMVLERAADEVQRGHILRAAALREGRES